MKVFFILFYFLLEIININREIRLESEDLKKSINLQAVSPEYIPENDNKNILNIYTKLPPKSPHPPNYPPPNNLSPLNISKKSIKRNLEMRVNTPIELLNKNKENINKSKLNISNEKSKLDYISPPTNISDVESITSYSSDSKIVKKNIWLKILYLTLFIIIIFAIYTLIVWAFIYLYLTNHYNITIDNNKLNLNGIIIYNGRIYNDNVFNSQSFFMNNEDNENNIKTRNLGILLFNFRKNNTIRLSFFC